MYKSKFILLVCLVIANSSLYAQDWGKITTYELDAENFMAERQFDKAAETFKKASKQVPENANFKYKIGFCYFNSDDKKNLSISYLEEAIKSASKDYNEQSVKETNTPLKSIYLLAQAYRINGQYNEAIETYNKYKEYLKPTDNLKALIDKDIANCSNAGNFIKDSISVKKTNMGNVINTEFPNINAAVSGDGNTIAYTSLTKAGNDIFVANKLNGVWSIPKKITNQLGNKYLQTCFLSFDGKDLYLSTDDPKNCDIFVTTIEKNKWISPLQFEKPINTKSNENHACLTKDGNTIYFTSDRKGSMGGYDIYKSVVNEKGVWGEPVNLGAEINTPFNEATPFLSADEKYLFFSSEGHEGLGGYDIFYVNLEGTPKVVNLGYPVNNGDNNLFYQPEKGLKSGFISFYDKNSVGRRDINHIDISRFTNLNGKILADDSNPFNIAIYDTENNDTITKLKLTSSKNFTYKIGTGSYKVIVENKKYRTFSGDMVIPDSYTSKDFSFEAKMELIPIEVPKLIAEVKKDTATIKQPKVIAIVEVPKTTIAPPIEIKKEVKPKIVPVIKIENTDNSNSSCKISMYAVQLMALKTDVGDTYFKNIENIEITQTSTGFYRYSVGSTESMEDAMVTLKRVKELGYEKAFVRIDRINAVYTIQLLAQKISVDLSTFKNVAGVNESKSADGYYRYSVGSFSSPDDAQTTLNTIIESGYKGSFIKKVAAK